MKFETARYPTIPRYDNLVKLASALELSPEEEIEFILAGTEGKVKSSTKEMLLQKHYASYLKENFGPMADSEEALIILTERPVTDILNALVDLTKEERARVAPMIVTLIRGMGR